MTAEAKMHRACGVIALCGLILLAAIGYAVIVAL
jgi:hypothetical protein